MRRFAFGMLPVGIVFIAACSGSSFTSVGADQACADQAAAACAGINKCGAALLQVSYGDMATCTARLKVKCSPVLAAPGTGTTPTNVEACSKAIASLTCDDLLARNLPADCHAKTGTIANGGACGDDSQCASSYCHIAPTSICGTCGTGRAALGGACGRDEDCDYGVKCANMVCVTPGVAGATCDANHPCSPTFVCKGGACATHSAEGAACDPLVFNDCSLLGGDYCGASKVCAKLAYAAGGAACGNVNGTFTLCTAGAICKGATAMTPGSCLAAAADGAMCDAINGPACQDGATCVNNVCKLSDPASCK